MPRGAGADGCEIRTDGAADNFTAPVGLNQFQPAGLKFAGAQREPAGQRRNIDRLRRRRERPFQHHGEFGPLADQGMRRRIGGQVEARIDRAGAEIERAGNAECTVVLCRASVTLATLTLPPVIVIGRITLRDDKTADCRAPP